MIEPGLYCDYAGLLAVAAGADGKPVIIQIPCDPEEAARKILDAVRAMRQAQGKAAAAGERPRLAKLGGNAPWN